jgi:hypothetical protein
LVRIRHGAPLHFAIEARIYWLRLLPTIFSQADAGIRDRKLDPVASVRDLAHPQRDLALFRELTGKPFVWIASPSRILAS